MTIRAQRAASVPMHTLKTVRRHHIDLRLPAAPPDDAEAFVVNAVGQGPHATIALTPADFQQVISILLDSWNKVTGQPGPPPLPQGPKAAA